MPNPIARVWNEPRVSMISVSTFKKELPLSIRPLKRSEEKTVFEKVWKDAARRFNEYSINYIYSIRNILLYFMSFCKTGCIVSVFHFDFLIFNTP